jgi:hypothetical protein
MITTTARSLERAALGLMLVSFVTVGTVITCLMTARHASEQGEGALVALADDVIRASQAQAAAERMIAVGRSYLLTREPELLVRAQAAEVKLSRMLQAIQSNAATRDEPRGLEPLLTAAGDYRETFAAVLSGEAAPREPSEIADALRNRLIPARDELIEGLDTLTARRLGQAEALRSSAHARRTTSVDLMLALGLAGVAATALLVWLVVRRTRELTAESAGAIALAITPSIGARPPPTHRLSRRALSIRPKP